MTSPIGHGLFAFAVYLAAPGREFLRRVLFFAVLFIAAIMPDFDYFPILWGDFRLANLNHQWFTHSIAFCLLASVILAIIGSWLGLGKALKLYPWVAAASLSHLVLDFLTMDSKEPIGIPVFWPFSDARFNSPVSLFGGLIKGNFGEMLSLHNLQVISLELLWLGSLVLITWVIFRVRRRREMLNRNSGTEPR